MWFSRLFKNCLESVSRDKIQGIVNNKKKKESVAGQAILRTKFIFNLNIKKKKKREFVINEP